MNLADLIDPAWARERCPPRAVPRVAPVADPAGGVSMIKGKGVCARIRSALDDAAQLGIAAIAARAGLTSDQVATNLPHLFASGQVERERGRGAYLYSLTRAGRARL